MSENDTSTDEHDLDASKPTPARSNQLVRREFAGVAMAHENAATQALIAKATADTQSRWIMAQRCPRDMDNVRALVKRECERPGFAEVAMYAVPRGGGMITGLSIRFAEVAMRCMGNMSAEAQTLFDSDEERLVRITTTDFESNATWTRDITVKKTIERKKLKGGERALRTRVNSYGDPVYVVPANDDEVATKEASAISKASRTGILRLVPGHIQDEVKKLCAEIIKGKAAKDPDGEKRRMFDAFGEINVMPPDIARLLGHPNDRISPAELVWLRQVFVAISNGDMGIDEAIASAEGTRAKSQSPAAKTAPAKTAEAKPANGNGQTPPPAATTAAPAGKGTTAAKDKIKNASKPAEKTEAPPTQETKATEPSPAAAPPKAEPPPAPIKDGYEERQCADCGAAIDVPIGDPVGAICYACSQA